MPPVPITAAHCVRQQGGHAHLSRRVRRGVGTAMTAVIRVHIGCKNRTDKSLNIRSFPAAHRQGNASPRASAPHLSIPATRRHGYANLFAAPHRVPRQIRCPFRLRAAKRLRRQTSPASAPTDGVPPTAGQKRVCRYRYHKRPGKACQGGKKKENIKFLLMYFINRIWT